MFKALSLIVVLISTMFAGCDRHPVNTAELFNKGNASYKAGDYKSAADSYQSVSNAGFASVALYYNLGNCFMKENQIGKAVLWYERALRLQPRDGDLRANYAYAQGMIKNPEPEESKTFSSRLFMHLHTVTLDEIVVILVVVLAGISVLILVGLFLKWKFRKTAAVVGLLSVIFIFHVFALFAKLDTLQDRTIILSSTEVKYEPEEKATTYFTAYEGWNVRYLKESSDWVKIERPDGLQGWIPKDKMEKI